jgi:hypothetical protein
MTAPLAVVAPRVAQLIKLLGSDRDGECLAAARALQRTLAAAGQDFHDLADAVESATGSKIRLGPERSAPAHHHECGDHRSMARWVRDSVARLSEKERGFVSDIASRPGTLSARQQAWLLALYERVSSERRRA